MSNPLPSMMHVSKPLTNLSVAFIQAAEDFLALKVFPAVPVPSEYDKYFVYDLGDFTRDEMDERAPGTESAGAGYEISTAEYACVPYGLHKDITKQDYAAADAPLDPDRDAAEFLALKGLIKLERAWHTDFFKTGVWSDDIEGAASGAEALGTSVVQWSDATNAKPVMDIGYYSKLIKSNTGVSPNILVLSPDTYFNLCQCDDILTRIKYTQRATITPELLASVLGVERVMVSGGVYNSAAQGVTDSIGYINTSDDALLLYSNPRPQRRRPSAGYTFFWDYDGVGPDGWVTSRFYMPALKSNRIEIDASFDQKQVTTALGIYFDDLIA
jgi:hypothetical protein